MTQQRSLRFFYIALGLIAIGGLIAIWMVRQSNAARTAAREAGPVPVNAAGFEGWVMGSDSAAVEIVEYADFECGACAHFSILTGPDIRDRLVASGRVRWRFRDFPLQGHPNSPAAHHAAACAGEQGRFWEMQEQIFYNQARWARDRRPGRRIRDYARAVGLDMGQYDDCMDEQRYVGQIQASYQEGLAVGVSSTPSFVIGDLLVIGSLPYDSVVALVERAERRLQQ
jgi:protein-disulfide isomerase